MNRPSGAPACCRLLGNVPAPKPVGKPALRPRGFMAPMRVREQVGALHEPRSRSIDFQPLATFRFMVPMHAQTRKGASKYCFSYIHERIILAEVRDSGKFVRCLDKAHSKSNSQLRNDKNWRAEPSNIRCHIFRLSAPRWSFMLPRVCPMMQSLNAWIPAGKSSANGASASSKSELPAWKNVLDRVAPGLFSPRTDRAG